MKYLKLFENYSIKRDEFPFDGHVLSPREMSILNDLVGNYYLQFVIKKEDGYYYTYNLNKYYNRFDNFSDLTHYILFNYFIDIKNITGFLELLRKTKLDMSFDNNASIRWASYFGHTEIVKILLQDPRVDPSDDPTAYNNSAIYWASYYGHKEIVKLLLEDPRVRSKLTPEQINKYRNEIS